MYLGSVLTCVGAAVTAQRAAAMDGVRKLAEGYSLKLQEIDLNDCQNAR